MALWKRLPTQILLIQLAIAIAGCNRGDGASPKEPVHVLTTVYALADVVRQIGGDRVNVEWFIESGQSLDALAETPERLASFRKAELVVTRGALEPWTLRGSGNEYNDRRILRVDALPASKEGDPSQYMWLDPQVILELADELATRLAALDPDAEKFFRANASAFRRDVIAAADASRGSLDSSNGQFVSVDPGFFALARRMGLDDVRLPASIRLDDPSPYGVRVIKDTATKVGARAIFANAQTPPALIRDWEARLALAVVPLDAVGSSSSVGRSTYLTILKYNLEQLQRGLSLGETRTRAPKEVKALGAPVVSQSEYADLPNGTTRPVVDAPPEAKQPEFVEPKEYRQVKYPGPPTTQSLPSSPFRPIPIEVQKR
jgi:ABC-type Zn uptake system ZnuABC Zn-binding protein ZnuA